MTSSRCPHGIDSRFCAICNRASRTVAPAASATSATSAVTLDEILLCLNETRRRATYGAIASVLGVPARSLGQRLGERRPEASWVVNADTGLPTDYTQAEWHPQLLDSPEIIRTGQALTLHLSIRRRAGEKP